jgi:hypothetical protein
MRTNPLLRRGIAVVVIALLIALAFAPSINADTEKKATILEVSGESEKMVRLVVTEHKPDGTKESKIVKLPQSQVKQMREELQHAEDIDERLSIYKTYGVIPEDVTREKLRAGIEEKTQKMSLKKEKNHTPINYIKSRLATSQNNRVTVMNYLCSVNGWVALGIRLYFGLSWFASFINGVLYYYLGLPLLIPSADLLNMGNSCWR